MDKKRLVIEFLLILLIMVLIATLYLYVRESNRVERVKRDIVEDARQILSFEKKSIELDVLDVVYDLAYLSDLYSLYLDGEFEKTEIETLWVSFSKHSKRYDQIRSLNLNGFEVVRVNYYAGSPKSVSEEFLQNKSDRYYFKDSIELRRDEYYVSRLDLNIEESKIELPIKPMIRFSMKSFASDGEGEEIIVLNYLADRMLTSIRENPIGDIYILNPEGFWVYGGNAKNTWAFMYEDRNDRSFSAIYPAVWEGLRDTDQLETEDGIFLSEKINFSKANNESFMVEERDLYRLVLHVYPEGPYSTIFPVNTFDTLRRIMKENLIIYVYLIITSLIIVFALGVLSSTIFRYKDLADFDSMTQVYNKRAGFHKLKKYITRNKQDNYLWSICFVDVDGLKQVNDKLGHSFGDELILTIVEVMAKLIRDDDFIIRYGGDEFLIIFTGVGSEIAEVIWGRILAEFDRINREEYRKYYISASHGIMDNYMSSDSVIEKYVKIADEKMYIDKKKKKSAGFCPIRTVREKREK